MLVLAMTRCPGLMDPNFSAVYGLVFCAGVYFPGRMAWWLPLTTLFLTDLLLNWHYGVDLINGYMLANYVAYVGILWLGRRFTARASWLSLLGGGILGAILFYLVTNTFAWMQNAEYLKTFGDWIRALTVGTSGWPQTWEFFRNTIISGGLFTGLFAGAMKLAAKMEAEEEPEEEGQSEPEPVEAEPEEAQP